MQIQPDKVFFNWRKTGDEAQYPHFQNVFNEFQSILALFLDGKKVDNRVNQLELTYFDHIMLENFGKKDYNPKEIVNLINTDFELKSIETKLSIPVNQLGGAIHLSLQSATRNPDQKKILVLESTCRGFNKNLSIEKWFDQAHTATIDIFKDITTDKAKKIWGMK